MRMQAELQMLFQDIDGLVLLTPGIDNGLTKKLAIHAKYLTQLNQQARLLLTDQFPNQVV
ncbi:hypothetical protein EXU85_03535 [Spirosoma sp. KCTC 42546]|uniref:hypothetical protein n=1 Tax=Spirosoma sp. KCTC 42546 TaxID=2520506 RepID=UPI00115908EB|nr:hypothetical protein [Spirosoma sp. KCTC 42546]QDK77715.1 hypothetical protein EXU85_03535 [Spirosoma sp. KCTC 42546]